MPAPLHLLPTLLAGAGWGGCLHPLTPRGEQWESAHATRAGGGPQAPQLPQAESGLWVRGKRSQASGSWEFPEFSGAAPRTASLPCAPSGPQGRTPPPVPACVSETFGLSQQSCFLLATQRALSHAIRILQFTPYRMSPTSASFLLAFALITLVGSSLSLGASFQEIERVSQVVVRWPDTGNFKEHLCTLILFCFRKI